jgi:hypothetical protein
MLQGLRPLKPKPSYQATNDHGRITAAWTSSRKTMLHCYLILLTAGHDQN